MGHPVAEDLLHLLALFDEPDGKRWMNVRDDPVSGEAFHLACGIDSIHTGNASVIRYVDSVRSHSGKDSSATRAEFLGKFCRYQCTAAKFALLVISQTPRTVHERVGRLHIDIHRKRLPVQFHLHHRAAQDITQPLVSYGVAQEFIR